MAEASRREHTSHLTFLIRSSHHCEPPFWRLTVSSLGFPCDGWDHRLPWGGKALSLQQGDTAGDTIDMRSADYSVQRGYRLSGVPLDSLFWVCLFAALPFNPLCLVFLFFVSAGRLSRVTGLVSLSFLGQVECRTGRDLVREICRSASQKEAEIRWLSLDGLMIDGRPMNFMCFSIFQYGFYSNLTRRGCRSMCLHLRSTR